MVSGANRKARGHREDFSGQMAPGSAQVLLASSQVSPAAQPGRTPYENEQMRMAAASRSPLPPRYTIKLPTQTAGRNAFDVPQIDLQERANACGIRLSLLFPLQSPLQNMGPETSHQS